MKVSLRDLKELFNLESIFPFPIGTPIYFRGCIYSGTGRIKKIQGKWLILSEATYITTDGRYSDATKNGIQNTNESEIEPVGGDGILAVNTDVISDICKHPEPLPSKQK